MFRIRTAESPDWEKFILPLIRKHPDYLQQDKLPGWQEFLILELFGKRLGCIALKIYWKKLAEIQSLVFLSFWLELIFAPLLIWRVVSIAKRLGVKQLMVTVGKRHRLLFWFFWFRRFSKLKYGLLRLTEGLEPYLDAVERRALPEGLMIEDLVEADFQELKRLPFPDEILTDPRFFPDWDQFCVVKNAADKIVGCCALTVFERVCEGRPEMAEIRTLFVLPEYEGQGLGPALCANRCRRAIELKVVELFAVSKLDGWFASKFGFGAIRGSEQARFRTLGK